MIINSKMKLGWQHTMLSENCKAGLTGGGVKIIKDGVEIVLTKEELINEFKIGINKGFFTIDDLTK